MLAVCHFIFGQISNVKVFTGTVNVGAPPVRWVFWNLTKKWKLSVLGTKKIFPSILKNIARGTTDPDIASITWVISLATKHANSVERKLHQVVNSELLLHFFWNAQLWPSYRLCIQHPRRSLKSFFPKSSSWRFGRQNGGFGGHFTGRVFGGASESRGHQGLAQIGHFLEQLVVVSSVCRGLAGINILGSAFGRMGARPKVFDESESFSVHIVYCLFYIFSSW